MKHIYWSIDTMDWARANAQEILDNNKALVTKAKRGIILFHDIHRRSVDGSAMLIDYMNKQNPQISWCTVQGVIDQQEQNLPSCK
jgi:peptidoglycan/xylan/chitin deacetylase (PgdA/CDA1 family)